MRVLAIDNGRLTRSTAEQALIRAGYLVDIVTDNAEGLYSAQNWEYDVILLDVMQPKLDGWSLLQTIREQITTPVIVLTEVDQLEIRIKSLDQGADDFVATPFDPAELLARIRAISRRRFSQSFSTLSFHDIAIDLASKEVRRSGELIELTSMEYRILAYLAQRAGRIVGSIEIVDALCDDNNDTALASLAVFIYRLRSKLGKGFIQTRRNLGYTIARPPQQMTA